MTSNHTDTDIEQLLRKAMDERADAFQPRRREAPAYLAAAEQRRVGKHRGLAPVLLAAAAVVALAVGVVAAIGGHRPGASVTPAAPSRTIASGPTPTETRPAPAADEPLPGGDIVTPLADPVTMTGSGTQTVHLGTPPSGTDAVTLQLTCLTAGYFEFPDGAAVSCDAADVGTRSAAAGYRMAIAADTRGLTITASTGERWRVTATYVTVTTTPWGVNERGQTYGVQNDSGTPDLVAAMATDGEQGYVLATDLNGPQPADPSEAATFRPAPRTIPVYKSDGVTQIGVFEIGG